MQYEVVRMSAEGVEQIIGTVSTPSFSDGTVAPSQGYAYRVRAVGEDATSPYGARDVATTFTFTDSPPLAGLTIRRAHVAELRDAVNALRSAAGLPPASWTDSIVAQSTPVRAAHILELRSRLTEAFTAFGLPPPAFGAPVAAGGVIRAAEVQELRTVMR